jgi:hypothetical protein
VARRQATTTLIGSALLFAGLASAAAQDGAEARRSLVDAAPAGTLFYLAIDVERAVTATGESELLALLRDEELASVVGPLEAQLDAALGDYRAVLALAKQYGFPAVIDGRIEIALLGALVTRDGTTTAFDAAAPPPRDESLTPRGTTLPNFVLVADTAGEESFGAAFSRLLELDPAVEQIVEARDGFAIHRAIAIDVATPVDAFAPCWTFVGDRFVAAMHVPTLALIASRLRDGSGDVGLDTLASDDAFARQRRSGKAGGDLLELWLAVARARPWIAHLEAMSGGERAAERVAQLDLLDIDGISLRLRLEDGRIGESLAVVLPGARRGALALFDALRPSDGIAKRVARDSLLHLALRIEPAKFLASWTAMLEPERRASLDEKLATLATSSGLDLRGELLDALGEEVALAVRPGLGFVPDFTLRIALRDADRVAAAMPQLETVLRSIEPAISFAARAVDRTRIAYDVRGAGLEPLLPVIAITDDALWVAGTAAGLRSALAQPLRGNEPPRTSADLERSLATTVGTDREGIFALLYLDLPRIAEQVFAAAPLLLPLLAGGSALPLSAADLPPGDVVAEGLSGLVLTLRASDGVLSYDASSPVGGPLVPALGLGAWLASEFVADTAQQRDSRRGTSPERPGTGATVTLNRARGVVVVGVVPDSPAARAGLRRDDVVLSVDGRRIYDAEAFESVIGARGVGATVEVEYLRGAERGRTAIAIERIGDYLR